MNRLEAISADTKRFQKHQEEHNKFLAIAGMLPESLGFKSLKVGCAYKADALLELFPQDHETILVFARQFPAIPLELERKGCTSIHPIVSEDSDNLPICPYYYKWDSYDQGCFHWWTRKGGYTLKIVCPTLEQYIEGYQESYFSHHDGRKEVYKIRMGYRSRFAGADLIRFYGDSCQAYWDTSCDLDTILNSIREKFQ